MLKKIDSYDGVCFFNGLIFYAPVALLIRTQAGVSNSTFFILQAILSLAIFLGEIPTGLITDKIGYKKSIVLSQTVILLARIMLMLAFLHHSIWLFVMEAIIEGVGACFSSGTCEAYIYSTYGEDMFAKKSAHSGNFGTAGFIISTITYVFIYKYWGMNGLFIATIISGIVAEICSIGLVEKKEVCMDSFNKDDVSAPDLREIAYFFINRETRSILILLSLFSLIWILINFFYVEKLILMGISEEWISVIILSYSMIQMLAEPIISLNQKISKNKAFSLFFVLAGIIVILLGIVDNKVISICIMCITPLFVSVPEYLLMERENKLIDDMDMNDNRAASLSTLNMGVNIVEIITLFLSSLFSIATIKWCFVVAGVLLLIFTAIVAKNSMWKY